MFRSIGFLAAMAVCGIICSPRGTQAATYTEVGGTGDVPATAQDVGAGIDRIVGELLATLQFTEVEVDMYKITFATAGNFKFETRSLTSTPAGGTLSDPDLFLFNSLGNPLAADDDGGGGPGSDFLDSAIELNLAAGTYYIAIGQDNTHGLDAGLNVIVDNDFGVQNAAGVIADWTTPPFQGGTYEILISQVPEPSSLVMAGIAAAGLCILRRRAADCQSFAATFGIFGMDGPGRGIEKRCRRSANATDRSQNAFLKSPDQWLDTRYSGFYFLGAAMEMNRNSWFMIGLIVLFLGIQFRVVDTFVLNEKASKVLVERSQAVADSGDFSRFMASVGPTPRKSIKPPPWLGFAMISVASVLILHSLAMKKPGG